MLARYGRAAIVSAVAVARSSPFCAADRGDNYRFCTLTLEEPSVYIHRCLRCSAQTAFFFNLLSSSFLPPHFLMFAYTHIVYSTPKFSIPAVSSLPLVMQSTPGLSDGMTPVRIQQSSHLKCFEKNTVTETTRNRLLPVNIQGNICRIFHHSRQRP